MKFIIGKDRNQTEFFCLEEAISTNNEVRIIDLFTSAINLADHGFDMKFLDNGKPLWGTHLASSKINGIFIIS